MTINATSGRYRLRTRTTWTLTEAKAKFSELVERAKSEGPQKITKHGRTTAVIVAADQWKEKSLRKGSLADFLMASPLRGSGTKVKRLRGGLRRVEL
jgi:prevent-host-death family protein